MTRPLFLGLLALMLGLAPFLPAGAQDEKPKKDDYKEKTARHKEDVVGEHDPWLAIGRHGTTPYATGRRTSRPRRRQGMPRRSFSLLRDGIDLRDTP